MLEGDFGTKKLAPTVKQWIEAFGGFKATVMLESVTHLVCTRQAWEEKGNSKLTRYLPTKRMNSVLRYAADLTRPQMSKRL
jgi:hypothetical protein